VVETKNPPWRHPDREPRKTRKTRKKIGDSKGLIANSEMEWMQRRRFIANALREGVVIYEST
jgi:hypothetical protein